MKSRDLEIKRRSARFQQLLAERRHLHPGESYDEAFRAVAESAAGAELIANMESSVLTADGKAQPRGGSDSTGARAAVAREPQFRNKEEAKAAFLKEVENLRSRGLSRDVAWNVAGNNTAKSAYQFWKNAAEEEKGLPAYNWRERHIPPEFSPS